MNRIDRLLLDTTLAALATTLVVVGLLFAGQWHLLAAGPGPSVVIAALSFSIVSLARSGAKK